MKIHGGIIVLNLIAVSMAIAKTQNPGLVPTSVKKVSLQGVQQEGRAELTHAITQMSTNAGIGKYQKIKLLTVNNFELLCR